MIKFIRLPRRNKHNPQIKEYCEAVKAGMDAKPQPMNFSDKETKK